MWTSFPAMEAVGAAETRHGEWSVTRLRSAARGTASIESLSLGVGPRGGLGEHGDSVSRLLVLTSTSLVERRPENYEVDILSSILYELLNSSPLEPYPRNGIDFDF
jgi:DnaJ family protein C protein 13